MANLVILDDRNTTHGQLMARCADLFAEVEVRWLAPEDDLSAQLPSLATASTGAVAMPFSYPADSSIAELTPVLTAIEQLMDCGVRVFIAAGNRYENPLCAAGIRITSNFSIDGVTTPKNVGTSGRTVMAAAHYVQSGHLPSA